MNEQDLADAAKRAAEWNAANLVGTLVHVRRLVDQRFERHAVTTSIATVSASLGAVVHVDGTDSHVPYMIDCLTPTRSQVRDGVVVKTS